MPSSTNKIYDTIIVGAGIAGLYAAYKIKKTDPKKSILILEKSPKSAIGGRAGTRPFHGSNVAIGAGVGRKSKDHLLIKLLRDLEIPYHEFLAQTHYANSIAKPCDVAKIFSLLRTEYNRQKEHWNRVKQPFSTFAKTILGLSEYKLFATCSGYTDYENADIYDVLYNYGFEDNFTNWTALSIPWNDVIQSLIAKIGEKNIHCSKEVSKIQSETINDKSIYAVSFTNKTTHYFAHQVILATTANSVRQLIGGSIYREIQGQSFLRVYGKFAKDSIPIMKQWVPKTTIVSGPIHKIIPINPDEGIYMIIYSDNQSADRLVKYSAENTPENRDTLCRLLERAIGMSIRGLGSPLKMIAIKSFYWPIGTHYYKPLNREIYENRQTFIRIVQNPSPGLYVAGEMISMDQGWVEGALDSVEKILPNYFRHIE